MRELIDAKRLLGDDIRRGLFTPFLGAGASSLRSGEADLESYPWKEVADILTAIAFRLSKRSRGFLRSFAKQRLNLSSDDEVCRIIPTSDTARLRAVGATNLVETPLVKFQVELVRATLGLTRYFGVCFSQESPSVHHLEDCSVKFELGSEEELCAPARDFLERAPRTAEEVRALARDCLQRLLGAADLALELKVITGGQQESPFLLPVPEGPRCLERQRLYEKLVTLIVGLVGRNRELYREQLAKHRVGRHFRIPYEVEQGKASSFGKLRLDAIQWMSDLLWYTVRYWVPCYPTTAELAFELSLAVKDAPPRRAELAQAAQALENEDPNTEDVDLISRFVGNLVTYCRVVNERKEGPDWQTKTFYYGIAAAMQFQFEKYAKSPQPNPRLRFQSNATGQQQVPVPVVFTTNFDSALEEVFEANNICFHIVFPVLKVDRPGDEKLPGTPSWMIKTCHPKVKKRDQPAEDWDKFCQVDENNGAPQISFMGPIIVKLHGAPSLALGEPTDKHWLVLSEAGYLEAVETGSKMPVWLECQLASNHLASKQGKDSEGGQEVDRKVSSNTAARSLWFLGYSISDWNVRLRLFEHCKNHRRLEGGRRNTVDRSSDVYRTAILGKLKVDQNLGDLNELPCMILEVLEDEERTAENSGNVRQLMKGIRTQPPRDQRWKAL